MGLHIHEGDLDEAPGACCCPLAIAAIWGVNQCMEGLPIALSFRFPGGPEGMMRSDAHEWDEHGVYSMVATIGEVVAVVWAGPCLTQLLREVHSLEGWGRC